MINENDEWLGEKNAGDTIVNLYQTYYFGDGLALLT